MAGKMADAAASAAGALRNRSGCGSIFPYPATFQVPAPFSVDRLYPKEDP
jgi:hypothetical protein